jgi:poly(3-hydroxybutyrate) depolymerase
MNRRAAAAAALLACAIAAPALAAPALPNGVADPAKVSVSGISSGGYMAVQMHFAHAETFRLGAGVVAGGPRNCAQGSVLNALGRCMKHLGDIPVDDLVAETRRDAASQRLAPLADVSAGKVYLFSGTRDETVVPAVMADLKRFYLAFLPAASVVMKNDLPASHSFVTEDFGPACDRQSEHFLNDCEFDLAGAILGTLAGDARGRLPLPRAASAPPTTEFDQGEFVTGHAMLPTGRIYLPAGCTPQDRCGLHVAFHGCKQNTATVGQDFTDHAGYNGWAATNRIIVLYPQAAKTVNNPNGCWDWWGHDDPRYAMRQGPQVRAVMAMVHRLLGSPADPPVAACTTATNTTHWWAGRATLQAFGALQAKGSRQPLGWWWQTSSLREWPAGQFTPGHCD